MGLDVQRFSRLFIATSCAFVKKYPVVSGISIFSFLLFIFLPSVFTSLAFSIPILIFITQAFRFIFRIHQQNLKNAKGESRNLGFLPQKQTSFEDGPVVAKIESHSISQPQSVRRRNVKEIDKRVGLKEGLGGKDKDTVFSSISNDALIDKAALTEENLKEIREVNTEPVTDRVENSSTASQVLRPECGDVSETSEDSENQDEEEAQEDRNKAAEWTEDDQKNLMELGISEMERNKRLDSLIAKRRAKKLLSMQVRRTLMKIGSNEPSGEIPTILAPKTNPFSSNNSAVSPTPGSAPSVLLSKHGPFNLPYDPPEEKPNVREASFDEQIMPPRQKDIFCRHESFSLGALFPGPREFDQNRRDTSYFPDFSTEQRDLEIPERFLLRNQPGNQDSSHDHIEQPDPVPEEIFDFDEVESDSKLVRDVTDVSSSSSSSERNDPASVASKEEILKSLSLSDPKNISRGKNPRRHEPFYDNSPRKRFDDRFSFPDRWNHHARANSIASDLQVEVSEVSSPEMTVDGIITPVDGELIYDGEVDVEKEMNSLWASSYESRLRDIQEVGRQQVTELGFSRTNRKSDDSFASDLLPEKIVEQDSCMSISASKTDLSEYSETHPTDVKVVDEVREASTCYPEAFSTENLDSATLENAEQSTDLKSESSSSHCSDSGKPEEPSHLNEKPNQEANVIDDANDQVLLANDEKEILEFIKDTYGQDPRSPEATEERPVLTMVNDEESQTFGITEGDTRDPENDHSKSIELFDGESNKQSEDEQSVVQDKKDEEILVDIAPAESSSSFSPPSLRGDKAPISEVSSLDFDQTTEIKDLVNDESPPVAMPAVVVEENPIASNSPMSPNSVLQNGLSVDLMSVSSFDQEIQMEAQQPEENRSIETPTENLTATMTEDSTSHQSNSGDSEDRQEPSSSTDKAAEEDIIHSVAPEKKEYANSESSEDGGSQKAFSDPTNPSDISGIEGSDNPMTDRGAVIDSTRPMEKENNPGTIKRTEEPGESTKFEEVEGPAVATSTGDNLEAIEREEPSKADEERSREEISTISIETRISKRLEGIDEESENAKITENIEGQSEFKAARTI